MKKVPEGLVETRPAVADEPTEHFVNGPPLGPPPRNYTRGLHDRIVQLIEAGNRPVVAAGMAGITSATFHRWIQQGREGNPHLVEFAQDVELAESRAEGNAVETVQKAALEDPEYAKWWLERARAKGWSKQVRTIVEHELEDVIERLHAAFAHEPKTFERILAAIAGETVALPEPNEAPVH